MDSFGADTIESLKATETEEPIEEEQDDSVAPVRYGITSFGVDFDVEGLYRRISRDEIVIPTFQRRLCLEYPPGISIHRVLAARLTSARDFLVARLRFG